MLIDSPPLVEPSPPRTVGPRQAARIAGCGYVAIFVLAIFANFVVRERLVAADDAAQTAANIAGSEGLFRLGMLAFLAVFVVDIVVAWALHVVFRARDHDLSLLAAWSRLTYTAFLGVAVVFGVQALDHVRDGADDAALSALDSFNVTWLVGLAAFGLHLGLLGVIVLRTGVAPQALGWLLALAGGAYGVDTIANIGLAGYQDYAAIFLVLVALPSIVAEGWLGLWLLLRAGRDRSAVRR